MGNEPHFAETSLLAHGMTKMPTGMRIGRSVEARMMQPTDLPAVFVAAMAAPASRSRSARSSRAALTRSARGSRAFTSGAMGTWVPQNLQV